MTVSRIAQDLQEASRDNLEAYEETGSAGIASERCNRCDRPLVVSAYGTWFGSPNPRDIRVQHYACICGEGKD